MVRSRGFGAVVFMEPRYRADESIDCEHARYDSCGPPRGDGDVWDRGPLTATVTAGTASLTTGQVNFCDASAKYCTNINILGSAQITAAGTAVVKFRLGMGSRSYKALFLGGQYLFRKLSERVGAHGDRNCWTICNCHLDCGNGGLGGLHTDRNRDGGGRNSCAHWDRFLS